jgi:amino acid transporter
LLGWSFVLSIFALQIGTYLQKLIPAFYGLSNVNLSLIAGAVIFSVIFWINYRGLGNSANLAYLLAIISLLPLIAITISPFISGTIRISNITENWLPPDWTWDPLHILFLFGVFGMAEWSACASEAVVVHGPEYKKPKTDVLKALFICSIICFFTFSTTQAAVTGVLGINGILAERLSPLIPLAQASFGPVGLYIVILMLIAAMVLLMQMAGLAASRAMHSMSLEGNLPMVFARTNKHGTPVVAMAVIVLVNELFILVGSPEILLAAAAFGYMLAHGVTLFSYVKSRRDPELAEVPRAFKAPRGWKFVALVYGIFTLPFCFIGLIFLNGYNLGWLPTCIGLSALALYLPIWLYTQHT